MCCGVMGLSRKKDKWLLTPRSKTRRQDDCAVLTTRYMRTAAQAQSFASVANVEIRSFLDGPGVMDNSPGLL